MSGRRARDGRPHPGLHCPQWVRHGWSTGGWGFVATVAVVAAVSGLTLAAGVIVVVDHPPPVWTFVALGVFALWQIVRRRAVSGSALDADDEDDTDPPAGNLANPPPE